RLANKVAIITGAGTGIGRAAALAFAREGAGVALVARRKERLEQGAAEIGEKGFVCPADITRFGDRQRVVRQTVERFGGVDILLNSAAVLLGGTAESHTEAEWDAHFDTNVKALWQLSSVVLPELRKRGGGSIINMSSVLGLVGQKNR